VKLPAHRAGLPGEEISLILRPLTPPTRRGLRGTFRSNVKAQGSNPKIKVKAEDEVKVKETKFLALA
jgi:hypothetical protein